ncbi:rhomboid family intramembrane serine protease [Nitrososphaera viennensis]|uniref:Rhomboid family intramembrane serine protease n=2 Tax=Nitrososphaera viennensis TaxID=1034015 RepID=A0A977IDV3_9ARCH|nr:rhomboid family intramembrane serine protease [Nitrososphaera viennensis]AIC17198.1 putative rhomboid family protein [Nitrososphaera viennensis EN76]UVS69085.1 rhomboid family intramembrane serine protease [Nitrososphaera viennensis]
MFPIHDDAERIHGRPWLNYTLMGINIAVFIWQASVTSFFTDERALTEMFLMYGTVPDRLFSEWPGSAFTVVTSMFMHGGIAHIIGNMVFLWVFGDNIEDKFGRVKYILLYIGWGFAAALLHSAAAVSTGDGAIPAVGASGAISGVLGAYMVMFPRARIYTIITAFFIYTVRIPVLVYIPFWFALQLIFGVIGQFGPFGDSGVAYLAHVGGFIAGAVTGVFGRNFILPKLASLAGKGTTYKPPVKKVRPKIEDVVSETPPEVIEGPGYYEIIAEIKGVADASAIHATYEQESKLVRITANGSRRYEMAAKLPDTAAGATVESVQYLNGIARIRLAKIPS